MATEEDAASDRGLTRKRRVRAAHCGSVTRLTTQIDKALISGNVRRLRQLKQSLTDKPRVLSKLDDELMELVSDEHLEEEVEAADLVKERIDLALISLDDALEPLTVPPPQTSTSPSGLSEASVVEHRSQREERSGVSVDTVNPVDLLLIL